ncbi:hypothetical protein DFH06DRAFT_1481350 [Mycena polygramma]|nr:hypothetical protein DFH06DRAFT_1481350 [Mycena polygramma]
MAEPCIIRLPTEILHEICALTSVGDLPWVFSHVCGRWRAAAISHSSSWCNISIGKENPPPIELLNRQLQFSNHLPLTIAFIQSGSGRSLSLFEALVARSNQWRSLSLMLLQDASLFLKALERVRGNVPILQRLSLEGQATTTGNPFAFEIAPSLQDVTLRFRPVPIIPWHQLTSLSTTCALPTLVPILQVAQNLIELKVQLVHLLALPGSNPPQIRLPLVSRCLLFHEHIVDVLVLPQLEIFVVEPDTALALVALLHRSSCSLKKLGLYGACSIDAVISILQACPELVEMTVVCSETAYLDLLIAQLSRSTFPDGDTAVLVPRLKYLSLTADDIDQTRFVDMVESRWRNHQLLQVAVTLSQEWNDADARRLWVFQQEGLDVRGDVNLQA